MTPKRIQLRRTRGWRKPEGAIVVSRPSRWGNSWTIRDANELYGVFGDGARHMVVEQFELGIETMAEFDPEGLEALIAPLRGHDLACWCPLDQPCHADVWLRLANS
jgi:hypothetical protein